MTANTKSPPTFTEAEAAAWTAWEEAEIRRLEGQLERARRNKNRGNEESAKAGLARLERGRKNRVDAVWRRNSIEETVQLAESRGEEVDRKPPVGAAIIWSRDGFAEIKKHFTSSQIRVGERYREAFEARGADLQASQISESGGGKGHDNDAFARRKLEQAKTAVFAKRCDREVRLRCIEHPSASQMLQWVVGSGRSIRAFGAGGRAYARNKAALAAALDVAIQVEAEMAEEARARAGAENPAQTSIIPV